MREFSFKHFIAVEFIMTQAPILEEILFRAIFLRASEESTGILYPCLVFSLSKNWIIKVICISLSYYTWGRGTSTWDHTSAKLSSPSSSDCTACGYSKRHTVWLQWWFCMPTATYWDHQTSIKVGSGWFRKCAEACREHCCFFPLPDVCLLNCYAGPR